MLYVNGDSHTAGAGLAVQDIYTQIVADHYGFKLTNQAVVGASNARILRTTKNFLNVNDSPDLVIIGWSTWEREEWLHNQQYFDVNSSGYTHLPTELVTQYKQWVINQNPDIVDAKSKKLHDEIYELHCLLTDKSIPHVFFNCMYNFFSISEPKEWNNCFIGPYNNEASYYWYLRNQGFVTDEWFHYKKDGHRAWATFLINYIDKYDIIRKR